jgi:hypothetical protein
MVRRNNCDSSQGRRINFHRMIGNEAAHLPVALPSSYEDWPAPISKPNCTSADARPGFGRERNMSDNWFQDSTVLFRMTGISTTICKEIVSRCWNHLQAIGISRYKLYSNTLPNPYPYTFAFTNTKASEFQFEISSCGIFSVSVLINGDHWVNYSCEPPTIVHVDSTAAYRLKHFGHR